MSYILYTYCYCFGGMWSSNNAGLHLITLCVFLGQRWDKCEVGYLIETGFKPPVVFATGRFKATIPCFPRLSVRVMYLCVLYMFYNPNPNPNTTRTKGYPGPLSLKCLYFRTQSLHPLRISEEKPCIPLCLMFLKTV